MKDDKDNKEIDSEELSNLESTVIFSINGETRNIRGYFRQKMRDIFKNANINIREYNLLNNYLINNVFVTSHLKKK